ncbi:calcium-binding protein, partial [Porticoccaceae bacterium]|nr:calcium-binding protein [Porticoccaceae bacterium]
TVGDGDNTVIGGQEADSITGGEGHDRVIGDNGEIVYGSLGVIETIESTVISEGASDIIKVGNGDNTVIGGQGSDEITAGTGNDDILGDNGVITYSNGIAIRIATSDEDENTGGGDTINAGEGDNRILAGLSGDGVTALGGDDVVLGDNGQLTYVNNILTKAVSSESALGGMDTLTVGDGDNTVIGGQEADSITGGEGHDRVIGDNGEIVYGSLGVIETIESTVISEGASDIIKVGNGDNTVIGGQGSDEITAGTGNDDILGDNGVITYSNGIAIRIATSDEDENTGGGDTINAGEGDNRILAGLSGDGVTALGGDDVVLGDNGEINYDLAGVIVSIHTHAADKSGNDIIVIDSGNNRILAGAGDDSVTTGAGDDVVIADSGRIDFAEGLMQTVFADHIETGKDYLLLGRGNNIAAGGDGDDTVVADAGDDWIVGDSGTFTLESGVVKHFVHTDESTGFDNLMSGEGRDVLIGGHGADTLDGQAGNDMVIGDFVEIKVGDDGSRDMQSILPTIGGDDSITGGDDFDILVGGAGTDMFFGNLSEDIIVGNYARIQDVPDSEALLVVSDPSNREVISSSMLEVYADEPAASEAAENRTFTADYSLITDDPAATKPLQADTALRLTPLLDGRDFKQMSDTELAEFLRNLPLVSAETSSSDGGVRSSEASQVTPENGELPVEESEAQKPGATEQLFEQETSAPLESKDNDASIESSGNTDLSAEMLASLLIAAKASRKRGWQLAGSEQNQGTIDGNLSDLREVQSERQFKPWHRH